MSVCDTIARRVCNQPGVFESKEDAIACANNKFYILTYTMSYIIVGLIIAIAFYIPTRESMGYMSTFIAAGILCGSAAWGYNEAYITPLAEQVADEREITKYMTLGSTRAAAINMVKELRGAQCSAQQSAARSSNVSSNQRGSIGFGNVKIGF